MHVRIWQSFSCNNSSSFRLVARFADPFVAAETAHELDGFLRDHARQLDELYAAGEFEQHTQASLALAAKYGLTWNEVLMWGGGGQDLAGDEPSVAAEHDVLVVYHAYCAGFGADLPAYLRTRGAAIDESMAAPTMSLVFAPVASAALEDDLALVFSQLGDAPRDVEPLRVPWQAPDERYGTASGFRDPGAVGLHVPIAPSDLATVKQWLEQRGVTRYAIRLCEDADEQRFAQIGRARCTACEARLEYLDPRIHDVDTEQLVCRACGGLYDLAALV